MSYHYKIKWVAVYARKGQSSTICLTACLPARQSHEAEGNLLHLWRELAHLSQLVLIRSSFDQTSSWPEVDGKLWKTCVVFLSHPFLQRAFRTKLDPWSTWTVFRRGCLDQGRLPLILGKSLWIGSWGLLMHVLGATFLLTVDSQIMGVDLIVLDHSHSWMWLGVSASKIDRNTIFHRVH